MLAPTASFGQSCSETVQTLVPSGWTTQQEMTSTAAQTATMCTTACLEAMTRRLSFEGIGQDPMPYPSYGIEFSRGLAGHLKLKIKIAGDDMWVKDNMDMYVRGISQVATSFDTLAWQEDSRWTYLATWAQDAALSRDSREGSASGPLPSIN